ncbi:GerAB/ArcD/ProY family transporter [Neobacillus niacini]|jgi:Spore germination protein|nr:GerAB/ArcD/ProY family transporter [Neobacillus niacini]
MFTTILYVILTVITYAFFNQGVLKYVIWPTLSMTKVVQMPFIERFEYLFIFSWMLVILPPVCLCIWSVTRGFKGVFNSKPSLTLAGIHILINVFSFILNDRIMIQVFKDITAKMSTYILLVYIPLLYVFVTVKNKLSTNKSGPSQDG